MYKYIFFDLDGTLTDSKPGIVKSMQHALAHYNINVEDTDSLTPFVGPPLRDTFKNFYGFSPEQSEEAVKIYRERYSTIGLFENELYEGIDDLCFELKKSDKILIVASSKPRVFIIQILEHFGIDKYFDVVVGSELDGTRDSKIEVIKECFNQLAKLTDYDISDCVMVGDRMFDIDASNELSMPNIGVSYGFGSVEELKEHNAHVICHSVGELKNELLK